MKLSLLLLLPTLAAAFLAPSVPVRSAGSFKNSAFVNTPDVEFSDARSNWVTQKLPSYAVPGVVKYSNASPLSMSYYGGGYPSRWGGGGYGMGYNDNYSGGRGWGRGGYGYDRGYGMGPYSDGYRYTGGGYGGYGRGWNDYSPYYSSDRYNDRYSYPSSYGYGGGYGRRGYYNDGFGYNGGYNYMSYRPDMHRALNNHLYQSADRYYNRFNGGGMGYNGYYGGYEGRYY